MLPEKKHQLRLVIVGDGPLWAQCGRLLDVAGLRHLAWLPGARDDVADLMRGMDLFILPSLAEGISNTILEAMACGLPVIATQVGGNPELVEEGITGNLIPAADPGALAEAMIPYLLIPGLCANRGRAGRIRTESQFSIESMVDSYMRVYDRVLERKTVQTVMQS